MEPQKKDDGTDGYGNATGKLETGTSTTTTTIEAIHHAQRTYSWIRTLSPQVATFYYESFIN